MRAATATLKTTPSSSGGSRTISVLQNHLTMVDVMVMMVMMVMGAYFKTQSVRLNHSIRKISPSGLLCTGSELFVILGMILP